MQWFYPILEKAINLYVHLDPELKNRVLKFQGKRAAIELLGLGLTFQLTFTADKIQLEPDASQKADTYIKGTPISLLHLTLSTDRHAFFAEDVVIEGNLEFAQQITALFDELEIDWEEHLAKLTGDVPAHYSGQLAANVKKFTNRIRKVLLQNVNEFTHEEIELFPAMEALEDFYNDVDEIRMDVDRMQARVDMLKRNVR